MGNAVAAALTGINVSGSATVTLTIQGSINRRVWIDLFSVALTAFGYADGSATSVKYAWLRAALLIEGTDVTAKVDVDVCFSQQ